MLTKILSIIFAIFAISTTIILYRLPPATLNLIAYTFLSLFTLSAIGAILFFSLAAKERYLTLKANRQKAEREAGLAFHSTPLGDYIYRSKKIAANSEIIPAHLLPHPYNGINNEPNQQSEKRWQIHVTRNLKVLEGEVIPPSQELPPLLPTLLKSQRLIIGGGSDSGKSTTAKHLIAGRAEDSQIVVIDPHAPSKILGFDVIGAGRNWQSIGEALESLELLMHDRYGDVAAGLMGYFEHRPLSIFIDEWTSIIEEVPNAGKILKTLLTESRKVNMFLTILTHSTTLDGLGLPSAQLKKSAIIVELVGGQDQPHRAFIHPQTSVDGKKPREYKTPGPFYGFPQPQQLTLELPSPKVIVAQKMANEGASLRSIAKEILGVKSPNGGHLEQVKQLLDCAKGKPGIKLIE